MKEKWILENKKADYRALAAAVGVSPLLVKLAVNRGYRTKEELDEYFFGTRQSLHDPALLKDADRASSLLLAAARAGQKVGIASDFDVDGIFSALILHKAVTRLGGQAQIYTPDRVAEGYGLNMRIVAQAHEDGASLLITCDNGIAAPEPIAYAEELGIATIVTDHHEVPFVQNEEGRQYVLPPARAIVNPRQADCAYPYKGLCGAGVTYKLAELLYQQAGIDAAELDELLGYAAIATVADVMDLTGENRILVRDGLNLLKRTENPGLRALMAVTGLDPGRLSAYHIGFVLGPCFNAAGRLSTVRQAFSLLFAETMEEALPLALSLKQLNDSRKEMTAAGVEQGKKRIEEQKLYRQPVMVVYLPDCHESLAGIIAGRLRETYGHPVYVIVDAETGLKGSGRSIEAYSMFENLQRCSDLLSRFGGHPMAAGLSFARENLAEFTRRINEDTGLCEEDFLPVVRIDAAAPAGYWSEETTQELDLLEPFGKGNRRPLFAEQHFALHSARVLGKNRNVLKLLAENDDGFRIDAIYYGDIEEWEEYIRAEFGETALRALYDGRPNPVDLGLAYYPSVNEYRGVRTVQIVVQHYCRIARRKA
ncbi:MAG: single-stranded-DNA-specific exonuclease RecJ [Lachnospiraceae bacterium]|nr:single-stranded-DNA-specific exonuclease RecJ [Lachnospiraceae bacterium]